jgi:hypothetical protein
VCPAVMHNCEARVYIKGDFLRLRLVRVRNKNGLSGILSSLRRLELKLSGWLTRYTLSGGFRVFGLKVSNPAEL